MPQNGRHTWKKKVLSTAHSQPRELLYVQCKYPVQSRKLNFIQYMEEIVILIELGLIMQEVLYFIN